MSLEMKKILFCFSMCLLQHFTNGQRMKTVACEKIGDFNWVSFGTLKTCFMDGSTSIDSAEYTISSPADNSVGAMGLGNNKKIRFLPENPADKFPNLKLYRPYSCSIEEISKVNFKDLRKLRKLYLDNNAIRKVASDTFEDLTSLEYLSLAGNKIKLMNGAVFYQLNKLTAVYLNGNDCIDDNFVDKAKLTTMTLAVTEKCGFGEAFCSVDEAVCRLSDQVTRIVDFIFNQNNDPFGVVQKGQTRDHPEPASPLESILTQTIQDTILRQENNLKMYEAQIEELRSTVKQKQEEVDKLQNQVQACNMKNRLRH